MTTPTKTEKDVGTNGPSGLAQRLAVFILAGPVALVIALLMTIGLHGRLDAVEVAPANRLASELVFFPLAWTLLMAVACYRAVLWKRTMVLGLAAALAAVPMMGVV